MLGLLLMLSAAQAEEVPDLTWLEGEWCTALTNGRQTCEIWGPARGGMMLGTSQTVRDGKTRSFEFMRIVWNQPSDHAVIRLAFVGAPQGKDPITFGWSPSKDAGVTFFNTAHDYPQRIRYWRTSDTLNAEISLKDGNRPMRWVYRRVR